MDTHIATLQATLQAINSRQSHPRHRREAKNKPFTSAILNRQGLDILTFIRDADPQLEASLFWYPPLPQAHPSSSSQQQQSNQPDSIQRQHQNHPGSQESGESTRLSAQSEQDPHQLLIPRVPEPRQIQPPTPLRQTKPGWKSAPSSSDDQFSAKTLLLAAQRLNDNYRSAPRARKHIKLLLQRHAELSKAIEKYERAIREGEEKIKVASAANLDRASSVVLALPAQSASATKGGSEEKRQELQRLKNEIQKEELEILALEAMTLELSKASSSKVKLEETGSSTRTSSGAPGSLPSVSKNLGKGNDDEFAEGTNRGAPSGDGLGLTEGGEEDKTITEGLVRDGGVGEQELAEASFSSPPLAETVDEAEESLPTPEPTDELERISENIWTCFGDSLRLVAPEREGADFLETLGYLRRLSAGGQAGDPSHQALLASGDTSLSSAISGSQASSGSTANAAGAAPAGSTSVLTATTVVKAFVLVQLVTSPAPHTLEMNEIKALTNTWWEAKGRNSFVKAIRALRGKGGGGRGGEEEEGNSSEEEEEIEEGKEGGEQLATKAVYSLVAKKLLRLRRTGGLAPVSFA
ncbi:hypothetical protein IE53DRAFT_411511 [Violaceomyces palustris]|uniref:Uncharacterized protein n=1 Tax=Violaceomyces palustris TaxID=1673888 RepID=A0ACD0NUT3_9BASI|nr:hypothetical protein IE53DRAFT_411511 [Violaceomyces palustris]